MHGGQDVQGESAALDCFAGGGEMGARMRSFDWAATPLGPVAAWPQGLRTSVSTCLNSRFAIVVWWGADLIMLYNDAYMSILGVKHPASLGRRGRDVWPEIWPIIDPMLHGVLEAGRATWSDDLLLMVERYGYPEESYFTFSYSPIRDETGGVGGVFTPVAETTEKVIGARRLRTLRDMAARASGLKRPEEVCGAAADVLAANAHDVPFALLYLLDDAAGQARLLCAAGLESGAPAAPALVETGRAGSRQRPEDGPSAAWPLADAVETGRAVLVEGLADRFGPLPGGAWPVPPRSALVLPITPPGRPRPSALLVAAVSPRRPLDAEYRTFYDLVAGQVASALADAQAHEEARRRAEALAELDRAKTTFFSNVSHEFRTPLTLLLGPLEEVLGRPDGPRPDDREPLTAVHRNGLRLLKLVNTLLDFSRIEAGRVEAAYEPTDLAAFTAELAALFRSAVERAGLRLVVDCPPLPEPVYVDRDMWEKVVLNLLSNAFKFTFDGTIEVRVRGAGGSAELSVRDTGTGIPADELPHLFERFHRVRGARGRTHEGTGIGLALVRDLIRLHGGTVRVESAPGQGSTFTVSMPLGRDHLPADRVGAARSLTSTATGAVPFVEEALRWLPDAGGDEPRARPDRPIGKAPKPRVLLADDNADMRDYVRRLLADRYEVETAADGAAALAAVRRRRPDLVVSDVMMPGLDGFALLRELRGDAATQAIPVILLSARAGEESRDEGLKTGADDYLVKPFTARELLARVAARLEASRVRREKALRETELYERESKLRRRAEEDDRRKDQFLATLAHELRNPLAPISNALQLMQLHGLKSQELQWAHDVIDRQTRQLTRLVDDLLEIGRISTGKASLRKQTVELTAVVAQAVETSRPLIDAGRHDLSVTLPPEPVLLKADPARLAQVLSNLLNNAAKYTEPGGRITLTAAREGAEVVLRVRDTGVGIPPEMLSQVFDLFTQMDRTLPRSQGGLGIGLNLVRSLVHLHGGTVAAFSDGPGRGSEFVVRLPAAAPRTS